MTYFQIIMMRYRWVRLILGLFVSLSSLTTLCVAHEIPPLTTATIVQQTLAAMPSCLHYKVTGVCFWQTCEGPICSINKTFKLDHYLPDAVVSIYRKPTSNPWEYANRLIDPAAAMLGNEQIKASMGVDRGYGNEITNTATGELDAHFKEADVIGNPAMTLFTPYSQLLLPSQVIPFKPYYLSMADAYLWRSPYWEMLWYPTHLAPGVHIVGSWLNNWGSVYPRTGFLNQPADAKAAAVLAQRAADIATRENQPHVYQVLSSLACGDHCAIAPARENNPDSQWQMIYPTSEARCVVFGENDLAQPRPWQSDAAQRGEGDYTWILWRRYQGCLSGQGHYLGSINF